MGYLFTGSGASAGFGNSGADGSGFNNSGDYVSGAFNSGIAAISGIFNDAPAGFTSGIANLRTILPG